jgi:hypothetical protein
MVAHSVTVMIHVRMVSHHMRRPITRIAIAAAATTTTATVRVTTRAGRWERTSEAGGTTLEVREAT